MSSILIATDFSAAGRSAALYGVRLAKALKAKAYLFTAYQVAHNFAALNVDVSHFDVRMQTQNALASEADIISNGDASLVDIVCEEGKPAAAIAAMAIEKEVDLIVVGMKGAGNGLKKLFGSITTALVNNLTIPTLIVPETNTFKTPKSILYASDRFMDTTIPAIDKIKWLTDGFSSKLFVVRVVQDSYEQVRESVNTPQNLRKELKTLKTSFTYPVNTDITDGLSEFLSDQPIDLLVMLPHKHQWLERLFVKSETKNMALHAHLPILMLPDPVVPPVQLTALELGENFGYDD